ncbi:MAG: hypothetical protein QNJ64_06105 [Crocosphaera sp.]|nr:hypothetical protein [Crocosphaera sp.]
MDHRQKKNTIRQKPAFESLEQDDRPSGPDLTKLENKTTIITLKESSSPNTSMGLWSHQPISLKQNSWTHLNRSSLKKAPKPSFQVFFWETVMTVALLIMALWMQSLPEREPSPNIKNDAWPTLETLRLPIRF